jgi:hypothetical protein
MFSVVVVDVSFELQRRLVRSRSHLGEIDGEAEAVRSFDDVF